MAEVVPEDEEDYSCILHRLVIRKQSFRVGVRCKHSGTAKLRTCVIIVCYRWFWLPTLHRVVWHRVIGLVLLNMRLYNHIARLTRISL